MGEKLKLKRMTIFSASISLVAFLYKMGLGIITSSLVLMVASISTLLVFVCKVLFINNVTATRDKKKKAYFFMALIGFLYSLIFILFVVLKVNGIDISNKNTYEGLYGGLFIGFILLSFILSLIGLKGALDKTDIMVIGLKEMTVISALTDLVIIEEFIYRIVYKYHSPMDWLDKVNDYFPLGVGLCMVIISMIMMIRFFSYKTKKS